MDNIEIENESDKQNEMKIVYVLHSTIMGGATISFLNLLEGLQEKCVEAVVLFPDWNEEFVEHLENLGVRYERCPMTEAIYPNDWAYKNSIGKLQNVVRILRCRIGSFRRMRRIIKRERPDIVHTNTGVIHEGFYCACSLGIPHVWHLREYQDRDFSMRIFPSKKFFIGLLRHSHTISITNDIHDAFYLPTNDMHRVIYNGVLSKDNIALSMPKEDFFLCSSRVSPEKGHEDVICAFAEFYKHNPSYRLVILGFGGKPFIEHLKEMSQELGCEESVIFAGYTDKVMEYMKRTKALIVASYNEGFGRMTAEAAFAGCIVIGRNTGGTKEIMQEIGGVTFMDGREIVEKMQYVANMTDEQYVNFAKDAQAKALQLYTNEINIDKTYKMYQDILKV